MGKSDAIPATSGRIQNTHVVHEALFLFSVDDRTNTFLSQHLSTPNFGKVQSLFPVSRNLVPSLAGRWPSRVTMCNPEKMKKRISDMSLFFSVLFFLNFSFHSSSSVSPTKAPILVMKPSTGTTQQGVSELQVPRVHLCGFTKSVRDATTQSLIERDVVPGGCVACGNPLGADIGAGVLGFGSFCCAG